MSLKAKIEAVIYASEEPVTLQQLVGLLGVEAQAAVDALEALEGQQGSLLPLESAYPAEAANAEELDPEALNAETLGGAADGKDVEQPSSDPLSRRAMMSEEALSEEALFEEALTSEKALISEGSDRPSPTQATTSSEASLAPPEESKKQTRERDRRLRDYFRTLLDRLIADYAEDDRGLEIREVAGGFRFATKPEFHDTVRGFVRALKPPLKLSLQALETLAVVAYKQPVTAPEVSEIRGVDSSGVLGSLISRKLVTTAGRKQVIGRPILYRTTKEFLLRFGLKDTSELPSIEEFERMAGELNEAVQEEMEMEQAAAAPPHHSEEATKAGDPASADSSSGKELHSTEAGREALHQNAEAEPMRDVHEAQADGIPTETFEVSERNEASASEV